MIEADNNNKIVSGYEVLPNGKLRILPKQIEFHTSPEKYVAYIGGVGSGKTWCGCEEVRKQCLKYANARWLVGTKTATQLKDTTRRRFFDGTDPRLIKRHWKDEDRLVFINNSEVIFRHLDDVSRIKSLGLTGFYIDEASEVKYHIFLMLQGRLRWEGLKDNQGNLLKGPTDKGSPEWNEAFKGIITSNSEGRNWLYKVFAVPPKREKFKNDRLYNDAVKSFANKKLIKAPSTENIFLPEEYVADLLASGDEDWIKRYVYAEFNTFEGQIYKDFNREVHVINSEFEINPLWKRLRGIDIGSDHPTACVWVAIDYDGNYYIYDEYKESGQDTEQVATAINEITGTDNITASYIDSADPNFRKSLIQYGINCIPSLKGADSVRVGIDEIKKLLRYNRQVAGSKPKLFIMEHCKKIMEEFEDYRWATIVSDISDKEVPKKENDDLLDALRYLIHTNLRSVAPPPARPDFGMDKRSEQEWKDTQKYLRKQKLNKIRYGTRLFKKKR